MDLTYSAEQTMLADSATRLVADVYGARAATPDFDPAMWTRFSEMGWLSLMVPESVGGLGAGAVEAGLVAQAFGRGLVNEPFLVNAVLAATLIARLGTPAQQEALLPALAEGRRRFGFALEESARYRPERLKTIARRGPDGGWRLDGVKTFALDVGSADDVLVVAGLEGAQGADRQALGLFVAPLAAPGLSRAGFSRLGGGDAARLTFKDVALPADALLGEAGDSAQTIAAALDVARAVLCCEALGMMEAALEKTAAYTKTRVQFNQPLSGNQVVRHRLADMAIAVEETRSLSLRACLLADAPASERVRAVSGAKAKISRHLRFVCEQAVQLHGGMGVTEELDIGRYLKRALAFETLFGDSDYHMSRRVQPLLKA